MITRPTFDHDPSCVPYRRWGLYWALTAPFLAMLLAVVIYLGTVHPLLALMPVACFASMCYFQAYCCAYQECPYIGRPCPAVIGILPANWLARTLYGGRLPVPDIQRFERSAALGIVSWVALALSPLYWLWRAHWAWAAAYALCHLAYALTFGLTICPSCAIRDSCPGGQFQAMVHRWRSEA